MNEDAKTVWLNIARWEERSVVNGPGERFVLWMQGCPFRCAGCINPDFLPFVERTRMTVEDAAALIGTVRGIEGVTFSGGDPMAQAEGLYHLSRLLKAEGLTVASYTGYTLEELRALSGPWIDRLLACLDLLIDGRYVAAQKGSLPWRGSDNQRVHFLSDAYRHLEREVNKPHREVEFIAGRDAFVSTGIFDTKFVRRLEQVLQGTSESPPSDGFQ